MVTISYGKLFLDSVNLSPKEIAATILEDVIKFSTNESKYQDDKTIVVIKRNGEYGSRQKIFDAGVVGAGGAGFPTHIKAKSKVEFVLVNGAECEPLIHKDYELMKNLQRRL